MKNINTSTDLRKSNILAVLRAIIDGKPATKTSVALKTGLTLMTVNTIMNTLRGSGIVTECGYTGSAGGRKAVFYTVNPAAFNIIGVNIGIGTISVALADFCGRIFEADRIAFKTDALPGSVIELIANSIRKLIGSRKIKSKSILGVGVTVPGPVYADTGIVRCLPNLDGWGGVLLKDILEENLKLPVFVEKDNYASVLYIKDELKIQNKNVVSMTVKGGIGTGLLIAGNLVRGENGIAGEIGHTTVDIKGARCNCGNIGCLEVYASDLAIVRNVNAAVHKTAYTNKTGSTEGKSCCLDIRQITDAAVKGNEVCRSVIIDAAGYIGVAVSDAIKFYDPAHFVINCRWLKEVPGASETVRRTVKERCMLIGQDNISLIFIHDDDAYLKGALMLVNGHILENTAGNRLLAHL